MGKGKPQRKKLNECWSCNFRKGDSVVCKKRWARVIALPLEAVSPGYVPILYDDEWGGETAVPADDLDRQ